MLHRAYLGLHEPFALSVEFLGVQAETVGRADIELAGDVNLRLGSRAKRALAARQGKPSWK